MLSDLAVYSEYVYSSYTETLNQQLNLFNAAVNGAITLQGAAHQGDFSDRAFFAKIDGLVRRRDAYGDGTVAEKHLRQLVDTMVKVAAGTPPVRIDPSQFLWIQQNPEVAGIVLGQQLAKDILADMLNTSLGCFYAAHIQATATNVLNITGRTAPDDLLSFKALTEATGKLGDGSGGSIAAWVTHSKPMFDMYANMLNNTERLFTFGTVGVVRDQFGKVLVMTDSPSLVTVGSPSVYHNLGLVPNAITVDENNDWMANEETKNGGENIIRTYQAEWSYNVGIKGYAWDKTNGGKSPTQAALLSSANWDRYATSAKDLGGVILESH